MATAASKPMPNILTSVLEFLSPIVPARFRPDIPVVPVVRLSGVIGVVTPLRPGLTLAGVARSLDRAFGMRNARAVALLDQFARRLAVAVAPDLPPHPAIGGGEEAAGARPSSRMSAPPAATCWRSPPTRSSAITIPFVGSIGVVGSGFGFPKLMDKLGVERRLYTSGDRKVMLDPFHAGEARGRKAPQGDPEGHPRAVHRAWSRSGAARASPDADKTLFSGEFWTAPRAIELGLADQHRRSALDCCASAMARRCARP